MYGSAPVVCVFARKTSEPLASLVKKIDEKIGENGKLKGFVVVLTERDDKIGENKKLKSFVVILTQQGEKTAEDLKKLASSSGIKNVPLTIHAGDAVQSGLKPGESVSPFDVEDITGPNKGKTLCYR